MLITVTKENFEAEIIKSGKIALIDFWASWCGPCKMIAPIVEEVAEECSDIIVGKVNVDEQPELANLFGITSIPTLAVVKDGKLVGQAVGYRQKEEILELLDV